MTACPCGANEWRDFTDVHTGTAYVACRACGCVRRASARGWVEWRVGIFVDDGAQPGSAWTQRVDPVRWSGVTDA